MRLSALADEYELAVDEGAAQFRSLFENSTPGVAVTNSAFHWTANPTFLTMLDYSPEELQWLTFLDICIDESRDECRKPLHELREGARVHYEETTVPAQRWSVLTGSDILLGGQRLCAPPSQRFLW